MNDGNSTTQFGSFEDFLVAHEKVCTRQRIDAVISWIVPVIFAIIVVVGVVGNSLVLFVVAFWQQMRNSTNVLILVSHTHKYVKGYVYAHCTVYCTCGFAF